MNPYSLPKTAVIGGKTYPISWDFRDILEIIGVLTDPSRPEFLRWHTALALFYEGDVPADRGEAARFLWEFVGQGRENPGPKLFDWQQDADAILSDVNRVAGREVRGEGMHWWTFLSFFHGIGQGQLSLRVGIRDKLRRGKKLEPWEQEYYRQNSAAIRLTQPETEETRREKEHWESLLSAPRNSP